MARASIAGEMPIILPEKYGIIGMELHVIAWQKHLECLCQNWRGIRPPGDIWEALAETECLLGSSHDWLRRSGRAGTAGGSRSAAINMRWKNDSVDGLCPAFCSLSSLSFWWGLYSPFAKLCLYSSFPNLRLYPSSFFKFIYIADI